MTNSSCHIYKINRFFRVLCPNCATWADYLSPCALPSSSINENVDNNTYFMGLLWGLNELIQGKYFNIAGDLGSYDDYLFNLLDGTLALGFLLALLTITFRRTVSQNNIALN